MVKQDSKLKTMEASHQHWSPDCQAAERGKVGGKKGTQVAQTPVSTQKLKLQPRLCMQQLQQDLLLKDKALQPQQTLPFHPTLTNPQRIYCHCLSRQTAAMQQRQFFFNKNSFLLYLIKVVLS